MAKMTRTVLKTLYPVNADTPIGICIPVYNAVANPNLATAVWSLEQCADLPFQLSLGIGPNSVVKNRLKALARLDPAIRFILMADDDVVASPHWASKMVALLESQENVGLVSATMMGPRGEAQNHIHPDRVEPGMTVSTLVPGTFIMYDREKTPIEWDLGYIGSQWEDTDAAMQVRQMGFKTVAYGNVQIMHKSPLSAVGGSVWNANKAYFESKWGDQWQK